MNLILSETNRSIVYLKNILENNIQIDYIIYYSLTKKKLYKILKSNFLKKIYVIKTQNINSKKIENRISKIKGSFLYSGYPSGIIKNKNILKRSLYHCHPGDVPEFKGSTTIFYALALKKKVTVSCFKLSTKIDEGKVVYKKKFRLMPNFKNLKSNTYDDEIRAKTFVEYINNKNKQKKFNLKSIKSCYYYIAHPVIRGIVLEKNLLNKLYKKI